MVGALRTTKAQRRAAGRRVLLGAIDENVAANSQDSIVKAASDSNVTLAKVDWTNETSLEAFFDDLTRALEQRIADSIDKEESNALTNLDTIESSYLMKMTKMTRKMTVRQFQEKYNSSLHAKSSAMVKEFGGISPEAALKFDPTDHGKMDEFGRPLRTPARVAGGKTLLSRTPATVRAPKRGEVLYSAQGSPIAAPVEGDDVMVSVKKPNSSKGSIVPTFSVNVGENQYIDVSDPSELDKLDPEKRAHAYQQLKSFQDQLGEVMGQFAKKWGD